MFERLAVLKTKGYVPDTILDIGAHHGNWTRAMRNIYPDSIYHLFEAIDYAELRAFESDSRAHVYNAVLSDSIKDANWFQRCNTGDSLFREKTHHFENCDVLTRRTTTLDTVLVSTSTALCATERLLIKIDCQGAELPILRGGAAVLSRADFVILEVPMFGQYNEGVANFQEHVEWMDGAGFAPYEFLDTHYVAGFNIQVDMMFIRKTHPFVASVAAALLSVR
jgi:FkbM family methyltransferase